MEVNDLLLAIDPIRTSIALTIPRIHDNKSTSSQTKEDVVEMLSQGRSSAQSVLDGLTRYYTGRGKLITKCIKFPQVHDLYAAHTHSSTAHTSLLPAVDMRVKGVADVCVCVCATVLRVGGVCVV